MLMPQDKQNIKIVTNDVNISLKFPPGMAPQAGGHKITPT
jgi:hypothetical protein